MQDVQRLDSSRMRITHAQYAQADTISTACSRLAYSRADRVCSQGNPG